MQNRTACNGKVVLWKQTEPTRSRHLIQVWPRLKQQTEIKDLKHLFSLLESCTCICVLIWWKACTLENNALQRNYSSGCFVLNKSWRHKIGGFEMTYEFATELNAYQLILYKFRMFVYIAEMARFSWHGMGKAKRKSCQISALPVIAKHFRCVRIKMNCKCLRYSCL